MADENRPDEQGKDQAGPKLTKSNKETKRYGKRIILVFILGVGALLCLITAQAQFVKSNAGSQRQSDNFRAPQPSGFAELAMGMRRDRRPAVVAAPIAPPQEPKYEPPEKPPQKKVVIRAAEPSAPPPQVPRYYSNQNDAQAASTLRTLKLQALAAAPVAAGFEAEQNGGGNNAQQQAPPQNGGNPPSVMASAEAATAAAALMQADPNGQIMKQDFMRNSAASLTPQGYSDSLPFPQQFPYELKAGTLIPGIMVTGINSDLPGNIIGQVSENVWDTATGRYVLIPKGTRILGVYDSQVTFGQQRILIVWNRLVFPNGTTLNIAGSPGVDQAGYSGLSGRVNEHWGTMLKSALLASVFLAGAEMIYDRDTTQNSGYGTQSKSPREVAAESVSTAILEMGNKIVDRAANIQPTITIRPGKRMMIFVEKDVAFPFPYF